jgi:hypothetical protein
MPYYTQQDGRFLFYPAGCGSPICHRAPPVFLWGGLISASIIVLGLVHPEVRGLN